MVMDLKRLSMFHFRLSQLFGQAPSVIFLMQVMSALAKNAVTSVRHGGVKSLVLMHKTHGVTTAGLLRSSAPCRAAL
jgi:hypothetical protein